MPKIETSALLERLAKGQAMPGILLLGQESYLRDLCRKAIIEAVVPENAREWGVARCDASEEDASAILALAATPSLLAPRQVVFVRGIEAWEKLGEKARDAVLADLAAYFARPSASSMLVLEAESLDQRLKLWKLLSEEVLVVGLELPEEPDARARAASAILTQMAKDAGVTLDKDAAEELTELSRRRSGRRAHGDLQARNLRRRSQTHHARRCRSPGRERPQIFGVGIGRSVRLARDRRAR
jgi:DNA polymerase III delta subunit